MHIRERSFEVDLATTLDAVNYGLFGIEKRVRRRQDVTLDFRNYINERITVPGSYQFSIQVNDEEGGSATGRLTVTVTAEGAKKETSTDAKDVSVKTGSFQFERAGPGRVKGAEEFGITWKTIEVAEVVIRLDAMEEGYSLSDEPAADRYEGFVETTDADLLGRSDARQGSVSHIDIPTAHNAASGRVLAIDAPDRYCLMKVSRSATSLSDIGTTVFLQGEYKCAEK